MIKRFCLECDKEFDVRTSRKSAGKYCCRKCYVSSRNHFGIKCKCLQCSKEFYIKPSAYTKGRGKYCSRKCNGKARKILFKGSKAPAWNGGKISTVDGRVAIYCPDHPKVNSKRPYIFEYRLLAEKKIGRYLLPKEIVHHLDGDVTNNDFGNLAIMTLSDHARIHAKDRRDAETGRFLPRRQN